MTIPITGYPYPFPPLPPVPPTPPVPSLTYIPNIPGCYPFPNIPPVPNPFPSFSGTLSITLPPPIPQLIPCCKYKIPTITIPNSGPPDWTPEPIPFSFVPPAAIASALIVINAYIDQANATLRYYFSLPDCSF